MCIIDDNSFAAMDEMELKRISGAGDIIGVEEITTSEYEDDPFLESTPRDYSGALLQYAVASKAFQDYKQRL